MQVDHRLPRKCPRCGNSMWIVPQTQFQFMCGICKLVKPGNELEIDCPLCELCGGAGILETGDNGVFWDEKCPECDGTGARRKF